MRRAWGETPVAVHHLVRNFVRESREFLSRRLAGQQRDLPACRSAACGRDFFGVFESDALLGDEFRKPLARSRFQG